jgi:hypothetical protein
VEKFEKEKKKKECCLFVEKKTDPHTPKTQGWHNRDQIW